MLWRRFKFTFLQEYEPKTIRNNQVRQKNTFINENVTRLNSLGFFLNIFIKAEDNCHNEMLTF